MYRTQTALCLLVTAVLSGCGGGGDTATPPTTGGVVSFPVFPGAGSNAPISANALESTLDSVGELNTAIADGTVAPPVSPAGQASMTGIVALPGALIGEEVIGNLTVNANFDSSTVTTEADGFAEFNTSDLDNIVPANSLNITGGSMSGNGTIVGSTMTSSLDGTLIRDDGNITNVIDTTLLGSFYDNGGTMVVGGAVLGTIDGAPFDNGGFVVSE